MRGSGRAGPAREGSCERGGPGRRGGREAERAEGAAASELGGCCWDRARSREPLWARGAGGAAAGALWAEQELPAGLPRRHDRGAAGARILRTEPRAGAGRTRRLLVLGGSRPAGSGEPHGGRGCRPDCRPVWSVSGGSEEAPLTVRKSCQPPICVVLQCYCVQHPLSNFVGFLKSLIATWKLHSVDG